MKPTQRKDALRNIRHRWLSFFSILLIVTLGVGGFLWPLYVKQSLAATGAGYYDGRNYHHMEMLSSLGVTEADLETIRSNKTVADAEGMRMAEGALTGGEGNSKIQILSMTERISKPELIEGRAPAAAGECALGADLMEKLKISIGDRVRIDVTDRMYAGLLNDTEYTVVGCMNTPLYLRNDYTYYAFVHDDAFDQSVLRGLYTRALVRFDLPASAKTFSAKFKAEVNARMPEIRAMIPTLTERRSAEVREEALAQLDTYRDKVLTYFDAMEAILKHADDLKAGEAKVMAALEQYKPLLRSSALQLTEFQAITIDSLTGEALFDRFWEAAMTAYTDARDSLVEKYLPLISRQVEGEDVSVDEEQLKEQIKQDLLADPNVQFVRQFINEALSKEAISEVFTSYFNKVVSALDTDLPGPVESVLELVADLLPENYAFFVRNYRSMLKLAPLMFPLYLNTYLSDLSDDAFDTMLSKSLDVVVPFAAGLSAAQVLPGVLAEELASKANFIAVFDTAEKMINGMEGNLTAALGTLTSGMTSREAAALARVGYGDLPDLLSDFSTFKTTPTWILLGRADNVGYADFSAIVDTMHVIAIAFASLFLILVVLVCFSSIAIMIDDQKKLIGATKSFGFFNREILSKYLLFGLLATVVGVIVGIVLAFVVETLITSVFTGYYLFGATKKVLEPVSTVSVTVAILLLVAGTIWLACKGVLKRPASALLSGSADHEKKKHGKASRAGTVRSRLILRNMRSELPRVLITCMIIVGCIILIGSGFTLKHAYDGMTDLQMNTIYGYDAKAKFEKGLTDEDVAAMNAAVAARGGSSMVMTETSRMMEIKGQQLFVNLVCADPAAVHDFLLFKDARTGDPIGNFTEGIVVQGRMCEVYGLESGDEVTVYDSLLNARATKVAGSFRNYLGRTVFTSPDAYRNLFGEDPVGNVLYVRADDTETLEEDLRAIRSDVSVTFKKNAMDELSTFSALLNVVVGALTLISILMLVLILINFTGIYLNRRMRDLAVMRINGFSMRQCVGYLIRETLLTNVIGILLGVASGIFVARAVVLGIEQPYVQFLRSPSVVAWVIAVTVEVVFSVLINYLVFRRVKRLKLTDLA